MPDGGEAGGPFSVATLPGLALWLKGDKGIVDDLQAPGRVKRWLDQSGNANNAEQWGIDGPIHDPQALNGIDVVNFGDLSQAQDGLAIADSASLKIGAGDFGMVFLAYVQPGQYPLVFMQKGSSSFILTVSAGVGHFDFANGVVGSLLIPAPIPSWQVYSIRGPAIRLKVAASSASFITTTEDYTSTGSPWLFGSPGNAQMKFAEVIVVKGALSDADLASTEAYLKAKYAF